MEDIYRPDTPTFQKFSVKLSHLPIAGNYIFCRLSSENQEYSGGFLLNAGTGSAIRSWEVEHFKPSVLGPLFGIVQTIQCLMLSVKNHRKCPQPEW